MPKKSIKNKKQFDAEAMIPHGTPPSRVRFQYWVSTTAPNTPTDPSTDHDAQGRFSITTNVISGIGINRPWRAELWDADLLDFSDKGHTQNGVVSGRG